MGCRASKVAAGRVETPPAADGGEERIAWGSPGQGGRSRAGTHGREGARQAPNRDEKQRLAVPSRGPSRRPSRKDTGAGAGRDRGTDREDGTGAGAVVVENVGSDDEGASRGSAATPSGGGDSPQARRSVVGDEISDAAAAAAADALNDTILTEADNEEEYKEPDSDDEVVPNVFVDAKTKRKRKLLTRVREVLEWNEIADMLERYVQSKHKRRLQVVQIEKVYNPMLEAKYKERCAQLRGPVRERLKFHGTSIEALNTILRKGFKIPKHPGLYGIGIYFATDSSKSELYAKRHNSNKLLLCRVALGKYWVLRKHNKALTSETVLKDKGYDSVYAPRGSRETGGVLFDEFIVYHRYQAIPHAVITFKALTK